MIEQKYIDQFVSEWLENEQNQSLFYHFIKEQRRIKGEIFRDACGDFGEMISDELLDELIILIGYRFSRKRKYKENKMTVAEAVALAVQLFKSGKGAAEVLSTLILRGDIKDPRVIVAAAMDEIDYLEELIMTLIGMSKETYLKILDEAIEIRYLVAMSGKLTNRPMIEKILMKRHNLTSDYARMFTKMSSGGDFQLIDTGPEWTANRPEPKLENYPEVAEFLKEK